MSRISDYINRLPGNVPVSEGGTLPMKEAINRAKKMGSTIPEKPHDFILYLKLPAEAEAEMLQRFGARKGGMEAIWQAAHSNHLSDSYEQGGIKGIGSKTEARIENLLSHLVFSEPMKEEPEMIDHSPPLEAFTWDPSEVQRLLALMVEVVSTSLGVQQRFNDTVERLNQLLAQQAERVETWNAAVGTQEAAEGTQTPASAEQGHQGDQQPSVAQQFRTGAPSFMPDEDMQNDSPVPDPTLPDTNVVPNAHKQHTNRVLLWKLAQQFNWHRAAVQMMCKNLSKDQDPQHLTTVTWQSILATMEDQQAIDYWHQQIANQR